MINWKVRIKSKVFWLTAIPAVLLLIQTIGGFFGVSLNLSFLDERLTGVVNGVFVLLAMLGIVADPTTDGFKDSEQALQYETPNRKAMAETYEDDRRDDADK